MKRFTSFAFSTFSVLLAVSAIAPTAQALPQIDSDFTLQTLRLSEMDARDKSETDSESYYPQADYSETSMPALPQEVSAEQDSSQPEPTQWESSEVNEETASEALSITPLSITQRRQESLDRRS